MMLGTKLAPHVVTKLRKTLSLIERNAPLSSQLTTLQAVATLAEVGLVTVERDSRGTIIGAWQPARCQVLEAVCGLACQDTMAAPLRAILLTDALAEKLEVSGVQPVATPTFRSCVKCARTAFMTGKLLRAWPVADWLISLDKRLCRRCGKAVAYPGADYCGNPCLERDKREGKSS